MFNFPNRQTLETTGEQILLIVRQFVPLLPAATVVPVRGGFSGARLWRIETGVRVYALRCWPVAGPEAARLQGLHHLLQHIAESGVHEIAVPVLSPSHQSLLWNWNHWWQLESWMPGVANYHDNSNRVRLEAAMSVLGHWHLAARSFSPSDVERKWFDVRLGPPPGLTERLSKFQYWQSCDSIPQRLLQQSGSLAGIFPQLNEISELVGRFLPRVIKTLEPLVVQPVALQPCLRDVWHDHLLFTGDRVTGLIDPGACRTDHVAADLSRLLGSLLDDQREEWQVALDFYQRHRPMALNEWNLLEAYDQSGIVLAGITWLEWLIVERRIFPDRIAVEQRLTAILRRLKQLALRVQMQ